MQFSDSHEWVKITNSRATIGVSQHAQKEIGEVVHVELPKLGVKIKKGQEIAVLESTKAAVDIYSPVSGKIVEVNRELIDHPELINEYPQEHGWLVRLELQDPTELEKLMDTQKYDSFVNK